MHLLLSSANPLAVQLTSREHAMSRPHIPWRFFFSGILACLALLSFWVSFGGFTGNLTLSPSHADAAEGTYLSGKAPVHSADTLKGAVDSLALGLGGAMQQLGSQEAKLAALREALDSLSLQPGQSVSYTAWKNTQVLHAPMAPDAAGIDFHTATDSYGNTFMTDVAGQAALGGFVNVLMPASPYPGSHSPEHRLVYAKSIPSTSWYIAAFAPHQIELEVAAIRHELDNTMRLGFCYTGLSLAGFAAILLIIGSRKREKYTPQPASC